MKFLNNIDLNKNELQNAVIQNLASSPSNPEEGQMYHNTTEHKTYIFDGTSWVDVTAAPETGTTDYADLSNKPQINSVTLSGNKSLSDLGIEPADNTIVKDADYVHTDNNYTSAEKTKLAGIEAGAQVNTVDSVNNKTGAVTLGASDVGAIPATEKGAANGVASLDANGLVPSAQLPSYVDDVLEYASSSAFPATGDTGKIYVALDTNKAFRWGGSTYVEISQSEIHKFVGTCTGDGTTTTFTITHSLGTKDVIVNVYGVSDSEDVIVDIVRTSTSAINVIFAVAPASGTNYKVVIVA